MTTRFDRYFSSRSPSSIFPSVTIRERSSDLYVQYSSEDKLETLANRVYGDVSLWWIILLANPEYAMEYEIDGGEIIRIPAPLNSVVKEIKAQLNG